MTTETDTREIDRQIALEVMGFDPVLLVDEPTEIDTRIGRVLVAPFDAYSTDIAAAWQVVERMRELGWWRFELTTSPEIAVAYFSEGAFVSGTGRSALTAPLAICKAALEATKEQSA